MVYNLDIEPMPIHTQLGGIETIKTEKQYERRTFCTINGAAKTDGCCKEGA